MLTITVQGMIPGDHGDPGTPLAQTTDLVVLDAAINSSDSQRTLRIKNSWFLLKQVLVEYKMLYNY